MCLLNLATLVRLIDAIANLIAVLTDLLNAWHQAGMPRPW